MSEGCTCISAVSCPSCEYPKDENVQFSQMCDYNQKQKVSPYLALLRLIFLVLMIDYRSWTTRPFREVIYNKRRPITSFEWFCSGLPCEKCLLSASLVSICRFLVWNWRTNMAKLFCSSAFPSIFNTSVHNEIPIALWVFIFLRAMWNQNI